MLLRKSDFESFNYCPYQFKILILLGIEPCFIPTEMSTGTEFHEVHSEFYDKVDFSELNKLQEYWAIWRYFRSLMPPNDPILQNLCDNFATNETIRWETCRRAKGNKAEYYFTPVALETYIESMSIRRRGHFDRVDRTFDDEFAVGEIKTGKPPGETWIGSIRRELVWYLEIMEQEDAMFSHDWEPTELYPISGLLPKPPKYIFAYYPLTNWILYEQPHTLTRKWLKKREDNFWECMRLDQFERNLGPHCVWCIVSPVCMQLLQIEESGKQYPQRYV